MCDPRREWSGKTTLLKIISKFLELKNEQGVIKYNGQNIQELDVENYFSHVLMVEQNSIIIEGSLEENILWGIHFPKKKYHRQST
ncbi:MAG: ATP-binding cassette domain-containing protein [Mediterraneibacter gnavus]